MTEFTAKILRGNMITVPKFVRDLNTLEEGDYVRFKAIQKVGKTKPQKVK